jgi:hypothetical protein
VAHVTKRELVTVSCFFAGLLVVSILIILFPRWRPTAFFEVLARVPTWLRLILVSSGVTGSLRVLYQALQISKSRLVLLVDEDSVVAHGMLRTSVFPFATLLLATPEQLGRHAGLRLERIGAKPVYVTGQLEFSSWQAIADQINGLLQQRLP